MEALELDYQHWRKVQDQHSDIWPSPSALKTDIAVNKQEWLEAEILLPCGNGSERQKWSMSWRNYVRHQLKKAKANAA